MSMLKVQFITPELLFIFGIQILQIMYTNTEGLLMTLTIAMAAYFLLLQELFWYLCFILPHVTTISKSHLSHLRWQNQQNGMCAQRRLRSAFASAQSDQSSVSAWRKLGSLATHWAHSEDWSDWTDAQADLSLRWAHMPFCWFCHEAAHFLLYSCLYQTGFGFHLIAVKGPLS